MGPTWFQHMREYDTYQTLLRAGVKMKSTNPAEIVTWRLLAGVDMRERMMLLDELKRIGTAIPVTTQTNPRHVRQLLSSGWEKIRAPNLENWLIAPDAQNHWQNVIASPSLWTQEGTSGNLFRAWMAYKNVIVPIKLGLSGFHILHVAHISWSDTLARAYRLMTETGDLVGALKEASRAINPFVGFGLTQGRGYDARMAWQKPPEERSPYENSLVETLKEMGITPQLPEQLRIAGRKALSDAINNHKYLKLLPAALRRAVEFMSHRIFERWIPGIKAAAAIRNAEILLQRDPSLQNDKSRRGVAMRAMGKNMDNRFGEMFYGNLYWNRAMKDIAIASELSLGWQLGFLREFVGAAIKPITYTAARLTLPSDHPYLEAARADNRIAYATIYATTAMMWNSVFTYLFTGESPKGDDLFFPRIGGKNPDGTPRRSSTPFFTREVPMLSKHISAENSIIGGIGGMLWNKAMFQPFKEMIENRDYWGYDIYDENAPFHTRTAQFLQHFLTNQAMPLSVTGAMRAKETAANWWDKGVVLSFAGFPQAPAYVERSSMENRIQALYQKYVQPAHKPYARIQTDKEKRRLKQELRVAIANDNQEAASDTRKALLKLGASTKSLSKKQLNLPTSTYLFSRLPEEIQESLLKGASVEDYNTYRKFVRRKLRRQFPAKVEE